MHGLSREIRNVCALWIGFLSPIGNLKTTGTLRRFGNDTCSSRSVCEIVLQSSQSPDDMLFLPPHCRGTFLKISIYNARTDTLLENTIPVTASGEHEAHHSICNGILNYAAILKKRP